MDYRKRLGGELRSCPGTDHALSALSTLTRLPDLRFPGCRLRLFSRTPIHPEVFSKVKDEILSECHLPAFDRDHSYSAVPAIPAFFIRVKKIPADSNDVVAG